MLVEEPLLLTRYRFHRQKLILHRASMQHFADRAVDYGVWFSYRWGELKRYTPLQVTLPAGKIIGLAGGTELAGLGAITLVSYRGVSSLGVSITIGLVCCLTATLVVDPAIGQLIDSKGKP